MRFRIVAAIFTVSNLLSQVSLNDIKHTHSLVLIQESKKSLGGHSHLKLCPLDTLTAVTDDQIEFNKLPQVSKALNSEHIEMLREGVEAILEPCSIDDVPIRSKKSACGFKIRDANGTTYVFVFKGSSGEKYQAWILPNSTLDIYIGQMSDEVNQIGDLIENETVELPYIPLPACLTRLLVKAGTVVLVAYFTLKEKLQDFYTRVHEKFLKERNDEEERKA